MKFISFIKDNKAMAGVINAAGRAVPFSAIEGFQNVKEVADFIKLYGTQMPESLTRAADVVKESYGVDEIKYLAPIPNMARNVICIGKNYVDHVFEVKGKIPDAPGIPKVPIYFSKFANPAAAHGDTVYLDAEVTTQMDYEAELAIVIGKTCKKVSKEEAFDYIFGYTVLNDLSARDIQNSHVQWFKGKNLDGYCPIGPVIAHKDEIKDPMNLKICSRVNGEQRQCSNTANMIFNIPFMIEDLSKTMTLYPGDIISTGTPEGVGMGFTPPKFLNMGDVVECEVEGIGILMNRIG